MGLSNTDRYALIKEIRIYRMHLRDTEGAIRRNPAGPVRDAMIRDRIQIANAIRRMQLQLDHNKWRVY